MGTPVVIAMEKAKAEVRSAVVKAQETNHLPAYLMVSVLTEILYDCKLVADNEYTVSILTANSNDQNEVVS